MIADYINIEVGQLFIADQSFWTSGETKDRGSLIKRKIFKGDILEIRYPYAWHFRTVENWYDHVDEKTLIKYCTFYGTIDSDVQFSNKHDLKQILDEKLFRPSKEHHLIIGE